MATKPKNTLTATDTPFVIEALRKLALQRDTLRKYALLAEEGEGDGEESESNAEALTADIDYIRGLLATLGDTKPLVLKSERQAKAKKNAKAKAKASKKPAKTSVKA